MIRGIAFSCIDNRTLFSYNEARKEKEAVMQSKAKIVIADDEKEIREVVSMLLTGEGYEVAAAADGREALACGPFRGSVYPGCKYAGDDRVCCGSRDPEDLLCADPVFDGLFRGV